LQVERPELVDADHAAVGGRVVVEVEDPVHVGGEAGVLACLPRLGRRLPGHARLEDLAQRLATDVGDPVLAQHIPKLGKTPGRERPSQVEGQHRAI
jgi:hypothetical protein